jgi:sugar fermentation stimulation protein A
MRRNAGPGGPAEFPDAITERGTKHLAELSEAVGGGARAVMLYLVQRSDCSRVTFADDLDPDYANALEKAVAAGVEAIGYACSLSVERIRVAASIPLELPGSKR